MEMEIAGDGYIYIYIYNIYIQYYIFAIGTIVIVIYQHILYMYILHKFSLPPANPNVTGHLCNLTYFRHLKGGSLYC